MQNQISNLHEDRLMRHGARLLLQHLVAEGFIPKCAEPFPSDKPMSKMSEAKQTKIMLGALVDKLLHDVGFLDNYIVSPLTTCFKYEVEVKGKQYTKCSVDKLTDKFGYAINNGN